MLKSHGFRPKFVALLKTNAPKGPKRKDGGLASALWIQPLGQSYMPEPWIPFQLASIFFTTLSGSGM